MVLERTTLKPELNFRYNLRNSQKDSLLEYLLKFFGILAGWCGSVVRIRRVRVQGPGLTPGCDFVSFS